MDELFIELWMKIAFHCDVPTFFNFPIVSKGWANNIIQYDMWKEYYHANIGLKQLTKQSWRGSLIVAYNTVKINWEEAHYREWQERSLVNKLIKTEMHILLEKTLPGLSIDFTSFTDSLGYAVARDNVELAKVLLKHNFPQSKDLKKLVLKRSNLEMILLLASEAALDDPKIFFNALESAQSPSIERLLNIGVDVHQQQNGEYPIHIVTRKKLIKMIKILIEKKGVSVNLKNKKCLTPLHVAIIQNDLSIVKYLTGKGAFVIDTESNNPHLALFLAADLSSNEIFFFLLNEYYKDIDISMLKNKKSSNLLHILSKSTSAHSKSTMENLLASYDFNINDRDKKNNSPLQYCLHKRYQKEKAELLLHYGADPNDCIIKAIQTRSLRAFSFLLSTVPDRVIWDNTKSHALQKSEYPNDFLNYLLGTNYDLTYKNNGTSFMHIYLQRSFYFNTGLMKACGIDINDKDAMGKTILDIAVSNGTYSRGDVLLSIIKEGGRLSLYDDIWVLQNCSCSEVLVKEGFLKIPPDCLFLIDTLPYYFHMWELVKFVDVTLKNEKGEDCIEYWQRTHKVILLEKYAIMNKCREQMV